MTVIRLLLTAYLPLLLPDINAQPHWFTRSTGLSQLLPSESEAGQNISQIDNLVRRESPDILALQRVDMDSFWNGLFDHDEFFAIQAEYPLGYNGSHKTTKRLDYGTAFASTSLLQNSKIFVISPTLAKTRKVLIILAIIRRYK